MGHLSRWQYSLPVNKKIPFIYDHVSTGILGISRDITSLEEAKQQLKAQTLVDDIS